MDKRSFEVLTGDQLRARRYRLAVAESCTGGLVGDLITNVPGSSDYFAGGILAYSNEAKKKLLDVKDETLKQYGAVSKQTALEMARGVRRQLCVDVGLSVTGIAGPGGGTPEKPVGLTWIGLSTPEGEWARQYVWQQDRLGNKRDSAEAALKLLLEFL